MWEFGGLWDELARRRPPYLQKRSLCIHENGEVLWLYQAEDSILMVEAKPKDPSKHTSIGQVVLKRLLSAEQVIERLCEENVFQPHWHQNKASQTLDLNTARDEARNNLEPAIAPDSKPLAFSSDPLNPTQIKATQPDLSSAAPSSAADALQT